MDPEAEYQFHDSLLELYEVSTKMSQLDDQDLVMVSLNNSTPSSLSSQGILFDFFLAFKGLSNKWIIFSFTQDNQLYYNLYIHQTTEVSR